MLAFVPLLLPPAVSQKTVLQAQTDPATLRVLQEFFVNKPLGAFPIKPPKHRKPAPNPKPVTYTSPAPKPVYRAPVVRGSIQQIITKWANHYGVQPSWLLRVASCESGFNIYAHNPSGATGLFQFMPGTFYGNGGHNLYSADDQARVAAYMFSIGQSGQWVCR